MELIRMQKALEDYQTYKSYMSSPFKSIKHTTYFPVYDHLFERFRGENITFVEIGVLGGGSLHMWRDYFGPHARIVGIDLNSQAKDLEQDGFEIFIGSQSDPIWLEAVFQEIGGFDILLDDGAHTNVAQVTTVEIASQFINDNGVIVVEDTHTSYMLGFGLKRFSFMRYIKLMIDKINRRYAYFSENASCEKRFWSLEIFESIVAFHVNKSATSIRSLPTINAGKDRYAEDQMLLDSSVGNALYLIRKKLPFLNKIKFVKDIAKFILQVANIHKDLKISKFFK